MERLLYNIRIYFSLVLLALSLSFNGPVPSGARAPASAELGCADAMEALIREAREFEPRGRALKESIPDYEEKITEIENSLFTPKDFSRNYFREYNQNPTLKELLEKMILGHQQIIRSIEQLGEASDRVKYFVAETVRSLSFTEKEKTNYKNFLEEYRHLLNERINLVRPSSELDKEMIQRIELLWKNPYGDFGELLAGLHFQGVEALGLHLRAQKIKAIGPKVNFHQNKIVEATSKAFNNLDRAGPETLARWKERFPTIFSGNRAEDLEQVKQWLESKEVDLITRSEQGRFYIIEVKNYNKMVDLETVTGGYRGSKSIYDQQIEMKEILEFLELDGLYYPAITFLKGVSPKARQLLEEAGIMVVDYP